MAKKAIECEADRAMFDDSRSQMPSDYGQLPVVIPSNSMGEYFSMSAAVQMTAGLASNLKRLLDSVAKTEVRYSSSGGKISRRRLRTVPLGRTDIFVYKKQTVAVNTAVSILVDRSGSMLNYMDDSDTTQMKIANDIAFSLSSAIELSGSVTEVLYYSSSAEIAKEFNENSRYKSERFDQVPDGLTDVSSALNPAILSIIKRPERRKAIFIITDGDTANPEQAAALVRGAEKLGICTYGIAIGTKDFIAPYIRDENSVEVKTSMELRDAMFDLAKTALLSPPRD